MTPGATYRLQFHAGFTLRDALALVPYLHDLGITHLYASPLLKARPGSSHGYDVIDHSQLNPEVGTEDDLAALAAALRERGMGMILDAVPNHMCVAGDNAWWQDVLEHGPSSPFADYFDIAWFDSPRPGMTGRLLLPVLGEPYGQVLETGQLTLTFDGAFRVRYGDATWPIDPRTFGLVLAPAVEDARTRLGDENADAVELQSILNAVRHLPPRIEPDAARVAGGRIECAAIKRRLAELLDRFPLAFACVSTAAEERSRSADALDELLEAQAYRLCFWRVASDEINYRRFFDVNELAALSTEREDVFRAVHKKWLVWCAEGLVQGLRIDHPDGLFDPKSYLARLREELPKPTDGRPWAFVVVEKILGDGEALPGDWACDGTTGYEFVAAVNGLFVDPAGEKPLTAFYRQFTGQSAPFPEVVHDKKYQILQYSLSSELNTLAHQLDRLARLDRRSRDFTLHGLARALREVIACFPVYRSYVNGDVHATDKAVVGKACHRARARNPLLGKPIFDFIRDTVLLKDSPSGPASDEYRAAQRRFAGKFQQLTAPVTAKGVEDTAFYTFNRLLSLNEVGGEPGRFGTPPEKVHSFLADRATKWTGSLSPLSTHDTKRSEDVRALLNVLSELPDEWAACVERWSVWNAPHKVEVEEGVFAPDANEEYALYQTLVGAWDGGGPEFTRRIQGFVRKALCEAKVHSSWINPDADYEAAVGAFVERILNPAASGEFLADLGKFSDRVAHFGRVNSLAQTLIRCTAPGVPDTYQGTDGWDFSLVDPDNRRPVDFAARERWLKEVREGGVRLAPELNANPADPRAKLFVVAHAHESRRTHPDLFVRGSYVPLLATGANADRVFAFLREWEGAAALVVVPRLSAGRGEWGDTALSLPPGAWRSVFAGEEFGGAVAVAEVFRTFPVALLVRTA
jgi:(1->4)-alpha-D-glucan 1-alpha-D-glucosylmutase